MSCSIRRYLRVPNALHQTFLDTDIANSPILNVTPRNAVLSRLFCDLFSDSITEDVYDADLAELSFNLWNTSHWIQISAGGFSDKLAVLTEKMLEKFVNYKVDEARFQEVAEAVSVLSRSCHAFVW